MMRRVAILGLGATGLRWAEECLRAGWEVAVFDPDPTAGARKGKAGWRRDETISATVKGADWVLVAVPERLELIRSVIQRAQAEAPEAAVIVSTACELGIDDLQGCAWRPAQVVQASRDPTGGVVLTLSHRNPQDLRDELKRALAAIAAVASLTPATPVAGSGEGSEASA